MGNVIEPNEKCSSSNASLQPTTNDSMMEMKQVFEKHQNFESKSLKTIEAEI